MSIIGKRPARAGRGIKIIPAPRWQVIEKVGTEQDLTSFTVSDGFMG